MTTAAIPASGFSPILRLSPPRQLLCKLFTLLRQFLLAHAVPRRAVSPGALAVSPYPFQATLYLLQVDCAELDGSGANPTYARTSGAQCSSIKSSPRRTLP
jgi:hypothetical protein